LSQHVLAVLAITKLE